VSVLQITELGLDPRLAEAAAALGWTEATPLQAAAIPVLRRASNVVLHASSGAGVTGAYALPLLERLALGEGGAGPRALVLAPSADGAARIASTLAVLGASAGVRVRALLDGWREDGGDVVVATAPAALARMEASQLKLEAVQLLVLVDLDLINRLGGSAAVDMLAPQVPRDCQRVVSAAELTPEIEHYVEAHARRALTIPARPADTRERVAPQTTGALRYAIVPDAQKADALVRLLQARSDGGAIVVARSEPAAAALEHTLALRGIAIGGEGGTRIEAAQNAPATGADISFDVPFDAELMHALHRKGGLVLVLPREASHLRRIAAEAGLALQAERLEWAGGEAIVEYRRMLRQAVHDEDLAAQLTLLEPLLEEFSASEIAAALSALLRRRQPPQPVVRPAAGTGAEAAATSFVRLFISLGTRDGIRPADLVGAITGEAGIKGEQVGKIDIRDTFSVVEISAAMADKVIRALNGVTLRGRSVRVDYDRKSSGPPAAERRSGGAGARRAAPPGRSRRPPSAGE
jgi:ATP-dependent RNA helicase DeaD